MRYCFNFTCHQNTAISSVLLLWAQKHTHPQVEASICNTWLLTKKDKAQLCFILQNSFYQVKHSIMPWKIMSLAIKRFEVQPPQLPPLFNQQKLKQHTNGLYSKLIFSLFTRNFLGTLWWSSLCMGWLFSRWPRVLTQPVQTWKKPIRTGDIFSCWVWPANTFLI